MQIQTTKTIEITLDELRQLLEQQFQVKLADTWNEVKIGYFNQVLIWPLENETLNP